MSSDLINWRMPFSRFCQIPSMLAAPVFGILWERMAIQAILPDNCASMVGRLNPVCYVRHPSSRSGLGKDPASSVRNAKGKVAEERIISRMGNSIPLDRDFG